MKMIGKSKGERNAIVKHNTSYVLRDVGKSVDHMEQVLSWL